MELQQKFNVGSEIFHGMSSKNGGKVSAYYTARKAEWRDKTGRLAKSRKKKDEKVKKAKRKAKRKIEGDGYMSKAALLKEQREDIADCLNPLVRGYLGRRLVERLRQDIAKRREQEKWAAIIIQKHERVIAIGKSP